MGHHNSVHDHGRQLEHAIQVDGDLTPHPRYKYDSAYRHVLLGQMNSAGHGGGHPLPTPSQNLKCPGHRDQCQRSLPHDRDPGPTPRRTQRDRRPGARKLRCARSRRPLGTRLSNSRRFGTSSSR